MPGLEYIITFIEWLQANPELSGVVYLLFFATVIAVGFPGVAMLWIASGMIYGTIPGAIMAVVGATLASLVTNLLVRTTLGQWLDKRAGDARETVRKFILSGNWFLLVVLRLIPALPLFVVNVALSAAGVPRKAYLISTFFGLIPLATIFASLGSQFSNPRELLGMRATSLIMTPDFLVPLGLLLLVSVAGWLWVRKQHQK